MLGLVVSALCASKGKAERVEVEVLLLFSHLMYAMAAWLLQVCMFVVSVFFRDGGTWRESASVTLFRSCIHSLFLKGGYHVFLKQERQRELERGRVELEKETHN